MHVYRERYQEAEFGTCPRSGCNACPVLPCGLTNVPGKTSVKLYCPRCKDVYNAKVFQSKKSKFNTLDGAAFGTTFCNLFFNTYPDLVDDFVQSEIYTPTIFGFKVSKHAKSRAKMRWLREGKLLE